MKTIYKFTVPHTGFPYRMLLPEGAEIIKVGTDPALNSTDICFWALVDTGAGKVERSFFITGTGQPLTRASYENYLGSVIQDVFIWHVFEVVAPSQDPGLGHCRFTGCDILTYNRFCGHHQ